MLAKLWKKLTVAADVVIRPFLKVFKDDESRFRLLTTFKISMIPIMSIGMMFILLMIVLRMTLNMFKAFGLSNIRLAEGVFYDYALSTFWETMPYVLILLSIQIFLGVYISSLFLRPFKMIGNYCEEVLEGNRDASYDPDFYTDLKLLTRFGEYFFNIGENALRSGQFHPIEVPRKFQNIHKPVFERDFFIQYSFFILLSSIVFGVFIHILMMDVFEDVIKFADRTLPLTTQVQLFLNGQSKILQDVFWMIVGLHILLNLTLSVHLYSKVSGPAFGIFATMRSFLRGNRKARVHLIGYYYVRKHCRHLNKYLDNIERNCMKE